jgi:hypothetical protein
VHGRARRSLVVLVNFGDMAKAVTVKGKLADPRHVELDEPVTEMTGPVEVVLRPAPTNGPARRSVLGLCADLGPAPSAEEIDDTRREMWSKFPRDDVA